MAGLSFATNLLRGWAAAGLALMFAIFDLTLRIPSALGAYGVPGAIRDPDQWSSIFIVAALCGCFLALAKASIGLRIEHPYSENSKLSGDYLPHVTGMGELSLTCR